MVDPFVAEIRIFAGDFAPVGWATCDGQLLPISQNTALFSLLGTNYGGNGKSNFGLPNLVGASPMFWGQGPGLSDYAIGEVGGVPSVTLLETEMPVHTHVTFGTAEQGDTNQPGGALVGQVAGSVVYTSFSANTSVTLSPSALAPNGGSAPHNNRQPYIGLTFIIALQGVFPQRS